MAARSETSFIFSSLGKKYMMGLTGMYFCLFLIIHLVGNLSLLAGEQAFNEYAQTMADNPLIRVASIVGFLLIFVHVVDGILLTASNRQKRPTRYAGKNANRNAPFAARNMGFLGALLLVFLLGHLFAFWRVFKFELETLPMVSYGKITLANRYLVVEDAFSNIGIVIFYVIMMAVVSLHTQHGFHSMFQSLGLSHPKYTPLIKKAAQAYSILIPAGFAAIPVIMYLKG